MAPRPGFELRVAPWPKAKPILTARWLTVSGPALTQWRRGTGRPQWVPIYHWETRIGVRVRTNGTPAHNCGFAETMAYVDAFAE